MGDRQIWYHIREGFRSIFTHGLMSFAAVCMTVACLLIMGSFSLIAVNANHVLGDLEKDNEFLAYIDDSLTREQGEALQSQIEAIPNVASATFVTKEQAWEDFKAQHDDKSYVFDESSPSTLRDRFVIHVDDIQLMSDTVTQVKEVSGIAQRAGIAGDRRRLRHAAQRGQRRGHYPGGDAGHHLHLHHRQHHQAQPPSPGGMRSPS